LIPGQDKFAIEVAKKIFEKKKIPSAIFGKLKIPLIQIVRNMILFKMYERNFAFR